MKYIIYPDGTIERVKNEKEAKEKRDNYDSHKLFK